MPLQQAAVLIGVSKTGGLLPLQAVDTGIAAMQQWIANQPGFEKADGTRRVVELVDAPGKPVAASDIRKAIKSFVESQTVEQLIVYFAGHGVNVRLSEYWLLSGAPDDPNEAVNLKSSMELARYCGIPHVVFVADACRTAANSIRSQVVEGSVIFPGLASSNRPGFVDVFYASLVGRPALEVRDAAAGAEGYTAVYTKALVDGLDGLAPALIETEATSSTGVVRPRPLGRHLQRAVPDLLGRMGAPLDVSQRPDAIITSDEQWLSEIEPAKVAAAQAGAVAASTSTDDTALTRSTSRRRVQSPAVDQAGDNALASTDSHHLPATDTPGAALSDIVDVAGEALRAALLNKTTRTRSGHPKQRPESPSEELFGEMLQRAEPDAVRHRNPMQCGFVVSGTSLAEAVCRTATAKLSSGAHSRVHVNNLTAPAAEVLLVMEDGFGTVLPAIDGFVATLTYDAASRELTSVEYERAVGAAVSDEALQDMQQAGELRRIMAAATALGVLRLTGGQELNDMVQQLRRISSADPSLAVYAAYLLHGQRQQAALQEIEALQRQALGLVLFDVAMLARSPEQFSDPLPADVHPSVPLLVQGWELLDARVVETAARERLGQLRKCVTDSPWTVFNEQGVELLRAAF